MTRPSRAGKKRRKAREWYVRIAKENGYFFGRWEKHDDIYHGDCCNKILVREVLLPRARKGKR